MATKPACVLTPKQIQFHVIRQPPELITPAAPTPYEFKELSNIDDQDGLRFLLPIISFYHARPTRKDLDPVLVIKKALSKALVPYYPLAGRVREKEGRKLVVECNAQGVLFVAADAPQVSLDDFGESGLSTPVPRFDQLFYDDHVVVDVLHSPIFSFQVTRLRCGGFIMAFKMNHTLVDGAGLVQFLNAVAELARGEKSLSVWPVWERHLLRARDPPRVAVSIPAYNFDNVLRPNPNTTTPNDYMVKQSFFIGPKELFALKRMVPPHLKSLSRFELLSACIWRCCTIAIQPDPDELMAKYEFAMKSLLESDKFNGRNFTQWLSTLELVVKQARKDHVLDTPPPSKPKDDASKDEIETYQNYTEDDTDVMCLMLGCMDYRLRLKYQSMGSAHKILNSMKESYKESATAERFNTFLAMMDAKHQRGTSVSDHVMLMSGYFEKLENLKCTLDDNLKTDIILRSLSSDFKGYIQNFKINEHKKTLGELQSSLKTFEDTIKDTKDVHLTVKKRGFKKSGKGKGKKPKGKAKMAQPTTSQTRPSGATVKEDRCLYCNKLGHWKRDCQKYKDDLRDGKVVFHKGPSKK